MDYKKNTRAVYNVDYVVMRLSVEYDGRQISAIAYNGDIEIASIVSVVHNLNILNDRRCYEVRSMSAVNNLESMCRLQRCFDNSLYELGVRYCWFETRNNRLLELADMLYTVSRIQGTNRYYIDLKRMYYHDNEHPNQ